MKVSELIEKLKELPQDAEVMKSHWDSGSDFVCYYDVDFVTYKEQGDFPNWEKHIVVL